MTRLTRYATARSIPGSANITRGPYARCLAEPSATKELETLLAADVAALAGLARPAHVRLALYAGRGAVARSGLFDAEHAAFAERLFSTANVDRYLLDVDESPSGGFGALAKVPRPKAVALGLISVGRGAPEDRDAVLDRLDEATAYIDADFLAVCPQRGFAGSGLTEAEQRRRLELVVSISTRYWGFEA